MEMTLETIAGILGGKLKGEPSKIMSGVGSFEEAGPCDITFAGDPRYFSRIGETKAGAVLVPENAGDFDAPVIYVENPRMAFVRLGQLFNPVVEAMDYIHPSACVGRNVKMGEKVQLHAHVVLGDNVTLGSRVAVFPNVVIGNGVTVGDDVTIYPNVTVRERCVVGNRVMIHSGTVIGSDGYGFVPDGERYTKIPHTGIVRIGDDVELGALNSIDRGTFGETQIKNGVKTDNQVHIAHNVVVGENTLLVAQVGIAGSTVIGDHAILAGQAGIAGHLIIGNNAVIGPKAGVLHSVADHDVVSGIPAISHKQWMKAQTVLAKLPELKKRVNELEKKINALEDKGES
jgi:UDP-3-O-[3-hydroxymyristoyl] glucosamine N-acyltransferase